MEIYTIILKKLHLILLLVFTVCLFSNFVIIFSHSLMITLKNFIFLEVFQLLSYFLLWYHFYSHLSFPIFKHVRNLIYPQSASFYPLKNWHSFFIKNSFSQPFYHDTTYTFGTQALFFLSLLNFL